VLNKGENLFSSSRVGCHDHNEPFLRNLQSFILEMQSKDIHHYVCIEIFCVRNYASGFWILVGIT